MNHRIAWRVIFLCPRNLWAPVAYVQISSEQKTMIDCKNLPDRRVEKQRVNEGPVPAALRTNAGMLRREMNRFGVEALRQWSA